ncbi:MAG: iron-sulfur cluster assembly accessory protein [Zoogloea oleivorans]|jgi:iron-sulfur cluster assembly accessory protein|uniref:HesB/IscA family protein n=1 Tax=Zoogloea oleivorans TaxID=1552750 RepID=UPI002A363471|nr:iron-sulfur cluster assembly accessory protein [Zoogloea oleivorans]MDY0036419.1 iron-sulfur cluster assembly accessory protein [Zoogloea oleivorans]
MLPNVIVKAGAEKFMRRMVRFAGLGAEAGFRLTVTTGGCSGYSAEFTVEGTPRDGDEVLPVGDLNVFLPAESRLLLEGVTIDFADTPSASGLSFHNPNAGACGCSSSSGTSVPPPGVATVDISAIRRT